MGTPLLVVLDGLAQPVPLPGIAFSKGLVVLRAVWNAPQVGLCTLHDLPEITNTQGPLGPALVHGNQLWPGNPVVRPLPLPAKKRSPLSWLLGLEGVGPGSNIARARVSRVKFSRVIQMCVVPCVVPCVAPCAVPCAVPALLYRHNFPCFREVNHVPAVRFLVLFLVLFLV